MPKTGGKKKGGIRNKVFKARRLQDITKDFDPSTFEVYGKVSKAMGDRRFSVYVQLLKEPQRMRDDAIICSIKGSYRKQITAGMYVLVKLFDFNNQQGQIIDSYTPEEVLALKDANMWDFPDESVTAPNNSSDSDSDDDDEPVIGVAASAISAWDSNGSSGTGADLDIDAI